MDLTTLRQHTATAQLIMFRGAVAVCGTLHVMSGSKITWRCSGTCRWTTTAPRSADRPLCDVCANMMTFDGDTDRPKPRKPSASAFHGKEVQLSSLSKADIQHLAYLIDHGRVSGTIRKLTREVVVPEGSLAADLRVLHIEARYMREEKEEGRWIITGDQASVLLKAGAYDADK